MSGRIEPRPLKRPFLDGAARANLAFLVTFLLFATIAVRNYAGHVRKERQEQQADFGIEASNRSLRLIHLLESRRALLTSVVAYFATSTHVSSEEFARYSSQLGELPLDALCWHSLDSNEKFGVGVGSGDARSCEYFDHQRPSQVYSGPEVYIILSESAKTHDRSQEGHVSIVMHLDSLALEDRPHEVVEHFVIDDLAHHDATSFRLGNGSVTPEANDAVDASALRYPLLHLHDMTVGYAATLAPHNAPRSPAELLFSISVVVVGLLAGAYLRNLLSTRTKISEQVRLKTAELSQFAYRTTHDLRGPLVTVTGLCRAVREDLIQGQTEEALSNVARIEHRVQRLDTLVKDILDISRADVGQFQAEPVDLHALAQEVREHVVSTLSTDAVRIELLVSADRPVEIARTRLFQILNNLLSNGVKYANFDNPDPRVSVSLSDQTTHLDIRVDDNGLGIPEEYHDRLFQMFERFHPKVPAVGSGLGMSIVKRHVDHLGGTIDVTSSPRGTQVHLRIPLRRH